MPSAVITAALEALEVCDYWLASEILLAALEEDGPTERPHRCSCGTAYEWPGLLAHHLAGTGHESAGTLQVAA